MAFGTKPKTTNADASPKTVLRVTASEIPTGDLMTMILPNGDVYKAWNGGELVFDPEMTRVLTSASAAIRARFREGGEA